MKTKKRFGISLELVRLDIKEIISNYRNPKFWKKKWVIFKTKDFDVVWRMSSINIEQTNISSIVEIINIKRRHFWTWNKPMAWCRSIPLDHSEYTQEVFQKNLLGAVVEAINSLEKSIVQTTYEYKEASRLEDEENSRLEDIANDFLDREGVTNKDIREAYIEKYVNEAARYNYTRTLLSSAIRRFYPTARLLAFSWFDDKKQFEAESKLLKEQNGIKKKLMYEIWKSRKELEGEDFIKEAEEKLESI